MDGWHHQLNGRESEWTPGVGDGQGGLACCDSWGCKELDTTEQLNWTELTGDSDQNHPQGKEMQKGKMVVWGGLTNSWEKKKAKGKGEKERYTHSNAEFQRITRRDKKDFLSDQCKEIEEKNRMGKTRYLFKKIRATKGTFHAKMGSIKDRNGMDLTEN